ncbi:MAG: DUF4012 domain-containing protein [Patescibacteria group bacterium]|nr:DUF4012 domain-containing protein [Patescibacteria group bacterium]
MPVKKIKSKTQTKTKKVASKTSSLSSKSVSKIIRSKSTAHVKKNKVYKVKIKSKVQPSGFVVDLRPISVIEPTIEEIKVEPILKEIDRFEPVDNANLDLEKSLFLPQVDFSQTIIKPREKKYFWRKFWNKIINYRPRLKYFQARPVEPKTQIIWSWQIFKNKTFLKPVLTFVIICLLIVVPIQFFGLYRNYQQTKAGFYELSATLPNQLEKAQTSLERLDIQALSQQTNLIQEQLLDLKNQLDRGLIITSLTKLSHKGSLANNFIQAGLALTQVVRDLNQTFEDFSTDFDGRQIYNFTDENVNLTEPNFSQRLKILHQNLEKIYQKLNEGNQYLSYIDLNDFDPAYQAKLDQLHQELDRVENYIAKYLKLTQILPQLVGDEDWQRYLVVFQNSNELRATGGFMGSYALIDFYQGRIINLEIPGGGFYDLEAGLNKNIQPPQPILMVNQRWEVQDANWWPDWPTSAQKISQFYEDCGGATVDGVISLNMDVVAALLTLTGPIEMSEYNKTIDSLNFIDQLQQEVEIDYNKEANQPKKIIADLTPELLKRIFDLLQQPNASTEVLKILGVLENNLIERNIQFYLTKPEFEEVILNLGWGGNLKETSQDYLMVVDTNLRGGKTDGVIYKDLDLTTEIQADGSLINTLKIKRTHQGDPQDIFTNQTNIDYVRVYVPLGSILLESQGFNPPGGGNFYQTTGQNEIDFQVAEFEDKSIADSKGTLIGVENNKTVFANWMILEPGTQAQATLVYKLPFKVQTQIETLKESNWFKIASQKMGLTQSVTDNLSSYNILVQKQSGNKNINFQQTLISPYDWPVSWSYPDDLKIVNLKNNQQKFIFEDSLNQDIYWGVSLKIAE